MPKSVTTIPLADIILDEGIYPGQKIDHKRVLGALPSGSCRRHAKEKNPRRDHPLPHHIKTGYITIMGSGLELSLFSFNLKIFVKTL